MLLHPFLLVLLLLLMVISYFKPTLTDIQSFCILWVILQVMNFFFSGANLTDRSACSSFPYTPTPIPLSFLLYSLSSSPFLSLSRYLLSHSFSLSFTSPFASSPSHVFSFLLLLLVHLLLQLSCPNSLIPSLYPSPLPLFPVHPSSTLYPQVSLLIQFPFLSHLSFTSPSLASSTSLSHLPFFSPSFTTPSPSSPTSSSPHYPPPPHFCSPLLQKKKL